MLSRDIHYFLVPDRTARKALLTALADIGCQVNVLVGTWPELIDHLASDYLVSLPVTGFDEKLTEALEQDKQGFWYSSYQVDPDKTCPIIGDLVSELLGALILSNQSSISESGFTESRTSSMVADLNRLVSALDQARPWDVQVIKAVLSSLSSPVRKTHVYHHPDMTLLKPWQLTAIRSINQAVDFKDASLEQLLENVVAYRAASSASTLGYFQNHLYGTANKTGLDDSVQWLACRDYRQEVEVAFGIVQQTLQSHPELAYSDFNLVVPHEDAYLHAVNAMSGVTGIPVSGLPQVQYLRDVARETVMHFLECQVSAPPAMSMASLLTSPLMPWNAETGRLLAQTIMDGNYELDLPDEASSLEQQALSLIMAINDMPHTLSSALKQFKSVIASSNATMALIYRAHEAIDRVIQWLGQHDSIDWLVLKRLVNPEQLREEQVLPSIAEGITITTDRQFAWHGCTHLIVLGFNEGRYPSKAKSSSLFNDEALEQINAHGIALLTNTRRNQFLQKAFLRQLGCASESCSFILSRLKPDGTKLHPAHSLVYMQYLLEGTEEPEELVLELDARDDRSRAHHIAQAKSLPKQVAWEPVLDDLNFDFDLLGLGSDDKIRALSPSRIEDLLVSPLAWLLSWLKLEPINWQADEPDVLILGSLAHGVYEHLFKPGESLPGEQDIKDSVEHLLANEARKIAPFMLTQKWDIERQKLQKEIIDSALMWRSMLEKLGARVIANEIWLKGDYAGVPIHGQADSLLGLPGDHLVVVDFKKSGHSGREKRMEKGYDSQVTLYREMMHSGLPEPHDKIEVGHVDVLYYMLNTQKALLEGSLGKGSGIPGWLNLDNDVSCEAMARIQQRVSQIRTGNIRLNETNDENFFEKEAGITPYALDKSPLVRRFTRKSISEEEE